MTIIIDGSTGVPVSPATGTLAVANGGTGSTTTPTSNGVAYGSSSVLAYTAAGTTGQLLTATTGGAPTWTTVSTASFPTGTVMLFVQTAAPTGWTKSTTHNDKALRVISGTVGTGGSVAFTTAFASQAVSGTNGTSGATTLSTAQIPAHTHDYGLSNTVGTVGTATNSNRANGATTTSTGGGGSHTHPAATFTGTAINLAVSYVDVIIATKD